MQRGAGAADGHSFVKATDPMNHEFKIGQTVTLTHDRFRGTQDGTFEILGLLPPINGDPQYLIKSGMEKCRRVVVQSSMIVKEQPAKWW